MTDQTSNETIQSTTEGSNDNKTQESQSDSVLERLMSADFWIRLAFMLLFWVVLWVIGNVLFVIIVFQCLYNLITGKTHEAVRQFGQSASLYLYQIFRFLTYNTEEKPFPFADWPDSNNET